ncbi:hypothetical protein AAE478_010058 [Parahypoxylon ruwenzoriense]
MSPARDSETDSDREEVSQILHAKVPREDREEWAIPPKGHEEWKISVRWVVVTEFGTILKPMSSVGSERTEEVISPQRCLFPRLDQVINAILSRATHGSRISQENADTHC